MYFLSSALGGLASGDFGFRTARRRSCKTAKITSTGRMTYGMKSVQLRPSDGPARASGRMTRAPRRIMQPVEVMTDLKFASSLMVS